MNGTAIRYAAWNEEPLKVSDGEGFLIRFAHSLYQDGADGAGTAALWLRRRGKRG